MRMRAGASIIGFALAAFALAGCGDDKKKDDDGPAVAKDGMVDVGFDGAAAGQQYVVMPYFLGDPATIEGGTADAKFSFSVEVQQGEGLTQLTERSVYGMTGATSDREYDHNLRLLLNRFDPSKGEDQGEWFWALAQQLDRRNDALFALGGGTTLGVGSIEGTYRKAARMGAAAAAPEAVVSGARALTTNLTLDAACPKDGEKVKVPNPDRESDSDPLTADATVKKGVDGGDYCIAYVDDAVTAGTAAEVDATVKTVVTRYKDVIYKDKMAATADGYTFKPVVVVLDFSNDLYWPQAKAYAISGAFLGAISKEVKMPMLYMASDFHKLPANKAKSDEDWNKEVAKQKKLWHSTIAHEMQHAAINYFRTHANNFGEENASVDEGLGHFMEDLFGYGDENFKDFAGGYLGFWADAPTPFLHATDSGSITRGAVQSFLYYLTSQKGGFTFTDGVVSGGGGLDYIRAVVTQSGGAKGAANLSARLGGDWLAACGNYLGALAADGTTAPELADVYKVAEPQKIKDLNGNSDKTFGMHFNGFGGVAAHDWGTKAESTTSVADINYYSTAPLLYTVADPAKKLRFTINDATMKNVAVAKVRIK